MQLDFNATIALGEAFLVYLDLDVFLGVGTR